MARQRVWWWTRVAVAGWVSMALAGMQAAAQGKPALDAKAAEDLANQKVEKALAAKLPAVDLEDMKFPDAVKKFRELAGVEVHVNWNSLKAAGVAPDSRVNLSLKNIAAGKVLELILADAAAGREKLEYIVDGGVVRISTAEDLRRVAVVRIYAVADLLMRRGNHPFWTGVVPATGLQPSGGVYEGEFGGVARATEGGFFDEDEWRGGGGDRAEVETRASIVQDLERMIAELVDPTSWRSSGGEIGSIRVMGARLIINQTLAGHRAIEALLAQLRKDRAAERVLSLHARWLVMDRQKARALLGKKPGELVVSEEAIKAADASVAYEGRITFFNGQVVHLAAGNVQSLLANIEPVVAEAAVAVRPVIGCVLWGALLETSAALIGEKDKAELKVRSVVAEPREARTKDIPFGVADAVVQERDDKGRVLKSKRSRAGINSAEIDLQDFTLQTFTTNLTVPLGKAVLVGGTTVPAKGGRPQAMYLVVQLTVAK